MITKSFKDWNSEEIENEFGLSRLWENFSLLEEWLHLEELAENTPTIERLRKRLLKNTDAWNEDELKMFFIAPLLDLVDFDGTPHYKAFTQRQMTIQTERVNCKGDVEFLVATGRKNPAKPFSFLHEYKQEEQRNNDALGQLLIAMVAAQFQNGDDMPLYGCYVLGRFWFFVALAGKMYSVNRAYDATQADIVRIITILQKTKEKIEKYLQ